MTTIVSNRQESGHEPIILGKVDLSDPVRFAQFLARKGALRLEIMGMKRCGRTMYAICKEQYDLTGSKKEVLKQMEMIAEDVLDAAAS